MPRHRDGLTVSQIQIADRLLTTGEIKVLRHSAPARLPFAQSTPRREGLFYRWTIPDDRTPGQPAATGRRLTKAGAYRHQHRVLTRLIKRFRSEEAQAES